MARVDPRTKTMSDEALTCRTLGHAPVPVPVPARERAALARIGQYMIHLKCLRGCTRWRKDIYRTSDDELVSSNGNYEDKKSYLVQERGTGRMPRSAARRAWRRRVGVPKD